MIRVMDINIVSEKLVGLRQEIRELQDLNSRYQEQNYHSPADSSAHDVRRLRLEQIKDELGEMKNRPYARARN
jgi:hypothetical protein